MCVLLCSRDLYPEYISRWCKKIISFDFLSFMHCSSRPSFSRKSTKDSVWIRVQIMAWWWARRRDRTLGKHNQERLSIEILDLISLHFLPVQTPLFIQEQWNRVLDVEFSVLCWLRHRWSSCELGFTFKWSCWICERNHQGEYKKETDANL